MAAYFSEGTFQCQIVGQGFDTLPTGTSFFWLEVRPIGRYASDGSLSTLPGGTTAIVKLWLTDKAKRMFAERVVELGYHGSSLSDLDPNNPDCHSFKGQCVDLVNTHNKDGYDDFNFPGRGPQVKNDTSRLRELDNLFGAALRDASRSADKKVSQEITREAKEITPDKHYVPF